jgi:hypothetical protein
MTVADLELTIQRRESVAAWSPRPADRYRSVVILGQATETNCALAAALAEQGQPAWLAQAAAPPRLGRGDLAIARLDVLPTLDGIEPGLWRLPRLERQGVQLLNRPLACSPPMTSSRPPSSSPGRGSRTRRRRTSARCRFQPFLPPTW